MKFFRLFLLLLLAILALLAVAYWTAISDPTLRKTRVSLPGWPEGEAPIRAVLISDLHVAGPDMPPKRLRNIVASINALDPDLVLIAGDFVSDRRVATRHYSLAQSIAPLSALRPRLGTFAVLGNHDHWRDRTEAGRALRSAGIVLLDNEAVKTGPLVLGGLDDAFTGHDDPQVTLAEMDRLEGAKLLLSHSPDPFPRIPGSVGLMLAGHTHCGQIRLPLIGALSTMSEHGDDYACGRVDENGQSLIVGAGLGTSLLPLRIGAVPDFWLIEIGPAAAPRSQRFSDSRNAARR
jgi:uncharacterized protein